MLTPGVYACVAKAKDQEGSPTSASALTLLPPDEGDSGTQSPQQKSLLLGSGRGGLNVHNNIITAGRWDRGTLHPQWHCRCGQ